MIFSVAHVSDPDPSGDGIEIDVRNGCPLLGKLLNYIGTWLLAIWFVTAADSKSAEALQWSKK